MPSGIEKMVSHKVLDVSRNATTEEIRLAYKKLALKWHPDRHTTDKENAQQKFIEIHDAYRILTERKDRHRSKRCENDAKGSGSSSARSTPPSSPKPSTSECYSSESHSTPPSSPQPSTHSSSRSHSHGSSEFSSSNLHNSDSHHQTPSSSPESSAHSHSKHSEHKFPHNHASDSHTGHTSSHHRSDRPGGSHEGLSSSRSASHSPSCSEFHCSSSHNGAHGGSEWQAPLHPSHPSIDSKSKPARSYYEGQPGLLSTPKSSRSKLRKQSKPALRRPDLTPNSPPKRRTAHSVPCSPISGVYPRGAGNSKEWRCPIKLTLEDLFRGKHLRFRLTRYLISNKKKHVIIDINVPPGCRSGTKIICPGIGHERKDGSLQDIIFVVEEAPHERFCRLRKNGDDLGMDVKVPWVKALEKEKGEVHFKGIDGKNMAVKIDYPNDRHMEGTHVVVGAGMPIRGGGQGGVVRRGDLVVRWEIVTSPTSTWENLKHKVLHFKD